MIPLQPTLYCRRQFVADTGIWLADARYDIDSFTLPGESLPLSSGLPEQRCLRRLLVAGESTQSAALEIAAPTVPSLLLPPITVE